VRQEPCGMVDQRRDSADTNEEYGRAVRALLERAVRRRLIVPTKMPDPPNLPPEWPPAAKRPEDR
jgi:hypothetical protein